MCDESRNAVPVSIGRAGASRKHDRWFSSRIPLLQEHALGRGREHATPRQRRGPRGPAPRPAARPPRRGAALRRRGRRARARRRPPGLHPRPAARARGPPRARGGRAPAPARPPPWERGARQLGLRPGPVRTLSALLGLYRGWGLRRPPVLAATNAAIARAAGCDERTVQKHLALLRARGLILVEYGPHNRRRPEPDAGPGDPAGIDLRPALVAAAELRALLDRLEAERRAAVAGLRLAQRALLLARAATAGGAGPTPEVLQVLEGHRRALRPARGGPHQPGGRPRQ